MMLDSNTQHLEGMHSDAGALHSLLAFEYHIHWSRKQRDKSVALRCSEKNLAQLQAQDFAHDIECSLELRGRIPVAIASNTTTPLALRFAATSYCD